MAVEEENLDDVISSLIDDDAGGMIPHQTVCRDFLRYPVR